MSHFYASIQGSRGEATRQGTKDSGMYGHIRGWDRGVRVECVYNSAEDKDVFHVTMTGGSTGRNRSEYLATIHEDGTIEPSEFLVEAVKRAEGL